MELTDYIKNTVRKHDLNINLKGGYESPLSLSLERPDSVEKALETVDFWTNILNVVEDLDFNKGIDKVGFFYQEHDKEIQLPLYKVALNNLGFTFKPKLTEGEIKEESLTPNFYRVIVDNKALFTTDDKEWKRLNDISQTTDDFQAPNVFMLQPYNRQVKLPLEMITGMSFKKYER
jgi:hypothetical protein